MENIKIAVVGTVGVPANYGGFETLAENLVKYHSAQKLESALTVYCSSKSYSTKNSTYLEAHLKYIPFSANGIQSILYDICSLISAAYSRSNVILLLGVSGAIALPLIRLFSSAKIVTNIDGIEWRRRKWKMLARKFLRISEGMAIRCSDIVIADNAVIAKYVRDTYGVDGQVIAYGGDQSVSADAVCVNASIGPSRYAFSVCRIEPENNVHVILEAFAKIDTCHLVMMGNWNNSDYGRALRKKYSNYETLILLDPVYDLGKLKTLRSRAYCYVHGHSAGGTNPSLVEAMHFGKAVMAFDCDYNRSTTEEKAIFFSGSEDLSGLIKTLDVATLEKVGLEMKEIANRLYTWRIVCAKYFALLSK